jgi:hypothetical protein
MRRSSLSARRLASKSKFMLYAALLDLRDGYNTGCIAFYMSAWWWCCLISVSFLPCFKPVNEPVPSPDRAHRTLYANSF